MSLDSIAISISAADIPSVNFSGPVVTPDYGVAMRRPINKDHVSGYLHEAFAPGKLVKLVTRVYTSTLRNFGEPGPSGMWDAIAFRGTSGACVAFPLAATYGWPILNVRKKNEYSHYTGVEGAIGVNRFLVVDDFIESGNTIMAIDEELKDPYNKNLWESPKIVGVVLYGMSPGHNRWNYGTQRLRESLGCKFVSTYETSEGHTGETILG